MQRMGRLIGINPEDIPRYRELHQNVWPEVLALLQRFHIQNYSIFLREPENLIFSYWEYSGQDFAADRAEMTNEPVMRRWLDLTDPLQCPLDSRQSGEWWSPMEQVFFLD